ncbi:MAG: hypothetical protein V7605_128 [Acidimicrobiaceae bacterium]
MVAVAALGTTWWVSSRHSHPARRAAPPPTTIGVVAAPPTTAPTFDDPGGSHLRLGRARAVGSPALVAEAIGSRVPLYSHAGDQEPGDVVDNPTFEGLPVTFLVMDQHDGWIEVQISRRPNEATAWVRADEVNLRQTPYKVRVDSAAHRLTLTDDGHTVLDVDVATGTGGTPTPTGTFFVDGIVKLANPNGPYGTYQLSVAAFSDVLTSFGGGNGQIAIHGTNSPSLVGTSVSHGCVRMTNADIDKLATAVGVGTPVEIY